MGIKYLNRFLRDNCKQCINIINISDLAYKKIAIDVSIYLYKYESENNLLENMFVMLSIFRHYNIVPIFIFDGKPPPEKKDLLQKRRENKDAAQKEYNRLKEELITLQNSKDYNKDKHDIISTMNQLKKQFVQINRDKIEKVKSLIRAYGATYFDAPGEADELCASLVIQNKVWACLSEDMDLFVYGCTRVLRYFSLISHTVVLYNTEDILQQLKMTHKEFKQICVLSGTDYNIKSGNHRDINLKLTIKYFDKYKKMNNENNKQDFYDWLSLNTTYISNIDLLNKINNMFTIETSNKLELFKNIKIHNGYIQQREIEEIMKDEDFIFL